MYVDNLNINYVIYISCNLWMLSLAKILSFSSGIDLWSVLKDLTFNVTSKLSNSKLTPSFFFFFICKMRCSTILWKPHVLKFNIIQFRRQKFSNHMMIANFIYSNCFISKKIQFNYTTWRKCTQNSDSLWTWRFFMNYS